MRQTLFVMVKLPRPGRVKTRLGRDIGLVPAAWWFRHQVARLLRRVADPRWHTVLAVSPDREGLMTPIWPPGFPRVPQGSGNLGDRMARLLRMAPSGPVCVIGADIPDVTRRNIAHGFQLLRGHDAVFGPAVDGGYWLVGLKRVKMVPPDMFQGVRWSTKHALKDSCASLPDHRIAFAETLRDVDRLADLTMT